MMINFSGVESLKTHKITSTTTSKNVLNSIIDYYHDHHVHVKRSDVITIKCYLQNLLQK